METLKIEHLAPYLPHKLKFYWEEAGGYELYSLSEDGIVLFEPISESYLEFDSHELDGLKIAVKPILRPLSDLTLSLYFELSNKEPKNDFGICCGKYNGLHDKRDYIHHQGYTSRKYFLDNGIGSMPYRTVKFFFEHHFDVFGLIDNNLAIDINQITAPKGI
ncbi:MAG TPA: hypothetical protein VFM69_04885 [Pricia sp.]|nr:hypothetical protein [Pricia sp.]